MEYSKESNNTREDNESNQNPGDESPNRRFMDGDDIDDEDGGDSPGLRKMGDDDEEYKEEEEEVDQWDEMEEEILRRCENTATLWEDPDFEAIQDNIYQNSANVPDELKEVMNIEWVRPKKIQNNAVFIKGDEIGGDMKQGVVGVTWFMSSVLMVSTRPEILRNLIYNDKHFDKGFVTFNFFKNGSWKRVIVDTRLPYDPASKQLLFATCADPDEFWLPLMEKAYAKLHGGYEKIMTGHIVNCLVDLTGYTAEKYDLTNDDEVKKMVDNGQLWEIFKNAYHQKFIIGTINAQKGKSIKNPEVGPNGILDNHGYGVLDVREFPKDDNLKLVKIRNPWGPDGCWNGPFSDDSEDWDKYRHLRDVIKLEFKSKKSDGTWWMSFGSFCDYLNKIYICRVYPDSWQNYSLELKWKNKTAGGPWNIIPKPDNFEKMKNAQMDTDEKWFNNPQLRVKIQKDTKLFVTLMQEDKTMTDQEYVLVNVLIAEVKDPNNRLWERPNQENIIFESKVQLKPKEKREIGQMVHLKKAEDKKFGYFIIIANNETTNKKEEQKTFWVRLFASEAIEVDQLGETIDKDQSISGQWNEITSGGRHVAKHEKDAQKEIDNPHWCRNPQYFLNLTKPTHFKIILKKGKQKTKNVKIGLYVCRFDQHEYQAIQTKKGGPGKKPPVFANPVEKLMTQTKAHLEPPKMQEIERKLSIGINEPFVQSSFGSEDVSALYFHKNPTEGPFIIVPCMEEKSTKQISYTLTIYSNNPVELTPLAENQNYVYIDQWGKLSAGGCHLNEMPYETDNLKRTWKTNPKFLLNFKENGPVTLKITLQVADKNWKSKIAKINKNTIGGMIGIYLLERHNDEIKTENMVGGREPSFVPMLVTSETYEIKNPNPNGYIVMPTTYEPNLQGTFIISASASREFEFIRKD